MRFLKTSLLILVLPVFLAIAISILDAYRTSYLRVSSHPEFVGDSYLIDKVHIIPMDKDTILYNSMIRIENGTIRQIGTDTGGTFLPVIDGAGKFLLPGLTDMHVHVWDRYELGLYLANGITAIRNMWGQPMHPKMKSDINSGKIIGPDFFSSGPKLTGPEFIGEDNTQLFSPEEAHEAVVSCRKKGYDFVKTYNGLTPELYEAIIDQASIEGLEIAAHPSSLLPYDFHMQTAIKTIEHAEDIYQQALNYKLDSTALKAITESFAQHPETALCPTLTVFANISRLIEEKGILSTPSLAFMNPLIRLVDSPEQFQRWQNTLAKDAGIAERIRQQHRFHLYMIRQLQSVGTNIVAGTDAGIGITLPGFSIHKELAYYKEAGLSNFEVLQTATANPAKTHDFLRNAGTIRPGKKANLILLSQNPLEDLEALKQPHWVMVNGHKLDSETLQSFVEMAKERKNKGASLVRYLSYLLTKG